MFDSPTKNLSEIERLGGHLEKGQNSALILVSFPHQLLHAISALRNDRSMRGIREDEPVTIVVWSHQAAHHNCGAPIRAVFNQTLESFPWIKLWIPTKFQRLYYLSPYRLLTKRAAWIRRKLKSDTYSSFLYSHDVSADHTAQAVMQAVPHARLICYGDPPGFIYPACNALLQNTNTIKQRIWKTRLRGLQNWLSAKQSIIAVDFRFQTGSIDASDVHLLPRQIIMETLDSIRSGFHNVATAETLLLNECAPIELSHILLLSNFTDSRMTTRQNELALYVDICKSYVPRGGMIYIKPHIGTSQEFTSQLIEKLADYRAVSFPAAIQQLPVELFPKLFARSHVLSVSSSSALIARLYGKAVTHVLTDDRIRRFFKSDYVSYMINANLAIVRKVKNHTSKFRLLISARDAGSAGHIAALATGAFARNILCQILADGPASAYLSARGISHITSAAWLDASGSSSATQRHAGIAAEAIRYFDPSIVVCGRSSVHERGIDEILISTARALQIPSLVVQDFWGDVWPETLRPDHYLVIDDQAAQLTRQKTSATTHVIGSLKHANYREIDFSSLRQKGRQVLGLGQDVLVIGFFGQDILHLEGYHQVLRDIGHVVGQLDQVSLFYKPHPRESEDSYARTLSLLRAGGASPIIVENLEIEIAVATADVVLSCFSTIGLDAAYMMCAPEAPEVSIICADYPEDVSGFWRPATELSEFPLVIDGIALAASDMNTLEAAIQTGLTVAERHRQANACRSIFSNPDDPIEKAYKVIERVVENDIMNVGA